MMLNFLFLQMLLCVGTFFSSEDECKSQWRQMVEGTITGVPTYFV